MLVTAEKAIVCFRVQNFHIVALMPPGNQPGTILIQDLRHLRHLILDGVRTDTDPLRQFLRSHRLFGGIAQLGHDLQGSAGHENRSVFPIIPAFIVVKH